MTDREKAGFRGLVAVCATKWPSGVLRESFHMDGRRRENSTDGDHGWTQRWLYDDRRRLKEVRTSDESGDHLQESYVYREDGGAVQTFYPRKPAGCQGVMMDSMLHLSTDAVRITTVRDRRGNAVEKVLYAADDRHIQRVLFHYDSAGRLTEEGEAIRENRIREDFRNRYRYDSAGCITEIERYTPFGGMRQTMTYNNIGDLMERHNMTLPTDIDLFVQPPWAEYFTYTYDERSNWLVRNLVHRLEETGETTHSGEENRQIEYWD
jgi:hypothetical protein